MTRTQIIVIAGANGAGKSTAAATLLPPAMPFINADEVAKTLPGYPSDAAHVEAARIVLNQQDDHESRRESYAVETTLAGRGLAARIKRLRACGYRFRLIFVYSPSAEFSIQRVAARVAAGGHDIPEETIRRRHAAGVRNFFQVYRALADEWSVIDSTVTMPNWVAEGTIDGPEQIYDQITWQLMLGASGP